ncbi:MAG: pyridoxamine 5'-phosphate oxidase family protein [Candidatus Levybacteria bacterium]|nr:pyridoxamine 5'-phosphate oxidase family protein [Candidatus Levybacteria bacterium]
MKTKSFNWKKYIEEALSVTDFCSIATVDKKGVWSSPVYFAWDKNYNFYFISQMKSRHMQNIKSNSRIAVSIYKTEQKGDIVGIQLEGTAKILSRNDGEKEINHAHDTYYGRAGFGPDMKEYLNNPTWLYVKITPENIFYFDTRFFGEERQLVPQEELK